MNKKRRAVLYLCVFAFIIIQNCGTVYAEDSINIFKKVAGEAQQIRNQYKERQNYLQEKQYLQEAKNTLAQYREKLVGNGTEKIKVGKTIDEVSQKQAENTHWFEQNQTMINRQAPHLKSKTEYSARMEYLEKEIENCEKLISVKEKQVKQYIVNVEDLRKQAAKYNAPTIADNSTFDEKSEAVLKALDHVEYADDRLNEANSVKNYLLRENGSVSVVDNRKSFEELAAEIKKVEANIENTNAQLREYYQLRLDLYTIREKITSENDLATWKKDVDHWQNEIVNYDVSLRDAIKKIEAEIVRLEKYLAREYYGRYISANVEYYSWEREDGFSGSQLYMPVTCFLEHGYSEFAAAMALVNTSADFGADEGLNGNTDVTVYYGYRDVRSEDLELKYTLHVELPVGESKIGEIPLSDDIIPVTRLSEGLNIRPGLEFFYRDSYENVWRGTIGYTFKDSYNYSKRKPGVSVDPGDGFDGSLSWTHAEKDYQLRFGVEGYLFSNDSAGEDAFSGEDFAYREGLKMICKAMYNRRLTDTSEIMGYYWLRFRDAADYKYPEIKDSSSTIHYYGLEYRYTPSEKHAWFIRNNNMSSSGSYYDPVSRDSSNDRQKHVLGAGYEYTMKNGGKIGVCVNNVWIRDKHPDKKYDGVEVLSWINTSF